MYVIIAVMNTTSVAVEVKLKKKKSDLHES